MIFRRKALLLFFIFSFFNLPTSKCVEYQMHKPKVDLITWDPQEGIKNVDYSKS